MGVNFFAYGTLQFREVMRAVTGRCFESQRATLHDYAGFLVKGQTYPGALQKSGASADGTVYLDVDEASLELLDLFEGDLYERRTVRVTTGEGEKEAIAYVVPRERKDFLADTLWDLEKFREKNFDLLLAALRGGSSGTK